MLDTFKSVDASVKPVEDLRLEVDSRRHTVADLSAQVDKLRSKLNSGADPKVEAKMEDTIKTLQHKEAKLTLTMGQVYRVVGAAEAEPQQADRDGKPHEILPDGGLQRAGKSVPGCLRCHW